MVPDYYTRKQTLTNAERYITPELKELEDMILGAEDKLLCIGIPAVFRCARQGWGMEVVRIQRTAKAIAGAGRICISCTCCREKPLCSPKGK